MGCGVGEMNAKEVLEAYKSFFTKERTFDFEIVIYGHKKKHLFIHDT